MQMLIMFPLEINKLLLLLGGLLLQVWYLKVDIPHQKLSGLSKKDVYSRQPFCQQSSIVSPQAAIWVYLQRFHPVKNRPQDVTDWKGLTVFFVCSQNFVP